MHTKVSHTCLISLALMVATVSASAGAELVSGTAKPRLIASLAHTPGIASLAVSPDGRFILTGGAADQAAVLWDVATGAELRRFAGHSGVVLSVAFSPDGRHVLTGSGGTVRMWDLVTGVELRNYAGSQGSFSKDGQLVLTVYGDTARLWDRATGAERQRFGPRSPVGLVTGYEPHRLRQSSVRAAALSPDGKFVLTGSQDGTARLWDVATGAERYQLVMKPIFELSMPETRSPLSVDSVAFSPDGQLLITSDRHAVRLWDMNTAVELRRFEGHHGSALSTEFSRNGQVLLTASHDGTARLWDVNTGKELQRLGHFGPHSDVAAAFSPDGRVVFTGGGLTLRLWDADTGSEQHRYELGLVWPTRSVAFSPDGNLLLTTIYGTVRLWDARQGAEILRLTVDEGYPIASAVSPNNESILTGSRDGVARLWDVATGHELHRFTGHTGGVSSVAFSPNGQFVVTGSMDKTARLWDVARRTQLWAFTGHTGEVSSVAFSPDGRHVLTGSRDETARLLEVTSGSQLQVFTGHTGFVTSVAFTPEGQTVRTGSSDRTARLWDVASGDELHRFSTGQPTLSFDPHDPADLVLFSPDGQVVRAGSSYVAARLWDGITGVEVRRYGDDLNSFGFSPDGRTVLTGDSTGAERLWDVASGEELARLLSFADGTWAVIDPAGRFDASNGGDDVQGLHWVVGLEPIELSQMKGRYYEPGLLAKILGFNKEPLREVEAFAGVALYPDVHVEAPAEDSSTVEIDLKNQGGGLGRVTVLINGKEIEVDARGDGFDSAADEASIRLDLAGHPYLVPGEDNTVEVKVYNAEGYLASRGKVISLKAPGEKIAEAPELWAVVAGISDYRGDALDLNFAAKDAAVFSTALESGAQRLFGTEKVHLTTLTTDAKSPNLQPTRDNLRLAIQELAKARPIDVVVVYLAGHGITHGGQDGDYYFLTQQASSFGLDDPAVRSAVAVSSNELTELIKLTPANKQVLILDTCGAGRVLERITEARVVPSSQNRALDRMKERMGLFILAGSAADAVSYETSAYGHGLLTYSLLEGMRGAALRDDEYVDVSRWFGYAVDRVPAIAKNVGGIQRPLVANPRGSGSFDVARLTETDRREIRLKPPLPFVIRAIFQQEEKPIDTLGLTRVVNLGLREVSSRGAETPWVFIDTPEYPESYQLLGRYSVNETTDDVTVNVYLFRENEEVGKQTVAGKRTQIDSLVDEIIAIAEDLL